jgi:hypothetical protein
MRTQTTILKISTALVISGVIFVTACKKDNNSSAGGTTNNSGAQTMTSNGATSDGAYDDVMNVAIQAGNDKSIDAIMTQQKSGIQTNGVRSLNGINGYYCANLTLLSNAGNFPDTLIVDFGAGCTSGDNIARSGSITYIFSGKLSTPGTTISATFNNYTVAGYHLGGTYSLLNSTTGSSLSLTSTVTAGTITYPNDSSYSFSGTKTVTVASGSLTDISTFIFNVTGGYTISNTNTGESLAVTVTTPLEKKESCKYVDAGVAAFVYTKGSLTVGGTLNYGDGTCDNSAVVTIGAATKTITLPW